MRLRPAIGFPTGASRHVLSCHVSVLFVQIVHYWINHLTVQLAEERDHLQNDLNCNIAACEAGCGPAQRRVPGRLYWPAFLIGELWPVNVGAEHARPI